MSQTKDLQETSYLVHLPAEMRNHLLLFFDWKSIVQYSLTSKSLRQELKENEWFWKSRCNNDFKNFFNKIYRSKKGWYYTHIALRCKLGYVLADKIKGCKYYRPCEKKALAILSADIANGINVNLEDEFGCTPLMRACHFGKVELVQRLLKLGANPHKTNLQGKNSLMFACDGALDNTKIVKLLLGYDINLRAKDQRGWTALMYATQWGLCNCARELMKRGIDSRDSIPISHRFNKPELKDMLERNQLNRISENLSFFSSENQISQHFFRR